MKWDDFKNKFKQDVQQQNVEVDVDSIWNAIESDVDAINNKRKRRFSFWIFFLGIGLVSGIGFYVFSNKNTNVIAVEDKSFDNKKEIVRSTQSADSQLIKDRSNSNELLSVNIDKSEKNVIVATKNHSKNKKSNQNINSKKSNNNSFTKTIRKEIIENKKETIVERTHSFPTQKVEKNLAKEEFLKNNTTIISKAQTEKTQFNSPVLSATFLLNIIDSEKSITDILAKNKSDIYLKELKKEWKPKKENDFIFSAEVFGGVSFVNRKIAAKDPSSSDLLSIRANNEYPLEANHLGLLLKLKTQKGIYFSAGIQQTTIAERYEYKDTNISIDSVEGVKTLLVNLTGDTIPRMGMIPRTTTLVLEKKIFNTYQLLDIPVFIGYETKGKNWQFGVEAGVLANISLKTEGIIPNELFDDIDIKTDQDEVFKSNIGLSYHLGMTASRKIKGNFWLTITPSLRILPKDFSTDNYGLSQKYTLFGTRVGVRYNFIGK